MARDEDFKDRRRREEREELSREEEKLRDQRKRSTDPKGRPSIDTSTSGETDSERFAELLARAEPMIEQLNNLYQMYIVGVEKQPPRERRAQLDQLVLTMQGIHRATPGQQFRWSTFQSHYTTHRDRWDKLMKDLEDGKIQRRGKG